MLPAGSQQPSTSRSSAAIPMFDQLNRQAREIYGVSESRPQDEDPAMLRFLRRANMEVIPPFPQGYAEQLRDWISRIPILEGPAFLDFSPELVQYQAGGNNDLEMVRRMRPPTGSFGVLAVDFVCHERLSLDGFICLASVSSPTQTIVADCLGDNRAFATNWISKMLTGKRVLKVLCGCEDIVFRLQKNWGCFGNGFVDLQDMFVIWKRTFPEECFVRCKNALILKIRERNRPATQEGCRNYFDILQSPGVDFLINVFGLDDKIQKHPAAAYADWTKRPLHADLRLYFASDSYFILKIFYRLYEIIGHEGLQAAGNATIARLLNRTVLPRYRSVQQSTEDQWIIEQIVEWRSYLGTNLDYHPDQILRGGLIPRLAQRITSANATNNAEAIATILQDFHVQDKFLESAKLLVAYLDTSGALRMRMRHVICHRCNTSGHVAKFCFKEPTKEEKKAFMARVENRHMVAQQNQRRRTNFCLKYGFDPATHTCPWEISPGIPKPNN